MNIHCSIGFEDLVLKLLLVIVLIAIFEVKFRLTYLRKNKGEIAFGKSQKAHSNTSYLNVLILHEKSIRIWKLLP